MIMGIIGVIGMCVFDVNINEIYFNQFVLVLLMGKVQLNVVIVCMMFDWVVFYLDVVDVLVIIEKVNVYCVKLEGVWK